MATDNRPLQNETPDEPLSESLRRVVEAMVAGEPVPIEAQAALTLQEQGEVAALARTANLTFITLQMPSPSAEAEARSLAKAQQELAQRPPIFRPLPPPIAPPRSAFQIWLDRLFKRSDSEE